MLLSARFCRGVRHSMYPHNQYSVQRCSHDRQGVAPCFYEFETTAEIAISMRPRTSRGLRLTAVAWVGPAFDVNRQLRTVSPSNIQTQSAFKFPAPPGNFIQARTFFSGLTEVSLRAPGTHKRKLCQNESQPSWATRKSSLRRANWPVRPMAPLRSN